MLYSEGGNFQIESYMLYSEGGKEVIREARGLRFESWVLDPRIDWSLGETDARNLPLFVSIAITGSKFEQPCSCDCCARAMAGA
jgi:hypothetical protein